MKNLKVSSLFHWLYGAVMFLPILLLPVFMIYSHRHTIDSGTLEVSQNEVVDFNQKRHSGGQHTYLDNGITTVIDDYTYSMSGTCDNTFIFNFGGFEFTSGHKFYLRYGITSVNNQYRIGDFNNSTSISYIETGAIYELVTSPYLGVEILNGTTLNIQFYFNAFDLTQMFGAGNEPTIAEFNQFFNEDYYSYTLSKKVLLKDVSTITYNDTDIMSQATYQLYNATDKYFNISQFFGFENLWDYMVLNWFGGNVTIYLRIFWQLLTYWLVVSIAWLIFDLFMYVPKLAHRWLDRSAIE